MFVQQRAGSSPACLGNVGCFMTNLSAHDQGRVVAMSLHGTWSFELDPKAVGEAEKWFEKNPAV